MGAAVLESVFDEQPATVSSTATTRTNCLGMMLTWTTQRTSRVMVPSIRDAEPFRTRFVLRGMTRLLAPVALLLVVSTSGCGASANPSASGAEPSVEETPAPKYSELF